MTVFKLLSGKRPFDEKKFEKVKVDQTTALTRKNSIVEVRKSLTNNRQYNMLLQDVIYPDYFSNIDKLLISGLLEVNEEKRLGWGEEGRERLMQHPFFEKIEWSKLAQKHVIPPVMPPLKKHPTKPLYDNFETMMETLTKQRRAKGQKDVDWSAEIQEGHHSLFDTWDFISSHTLKVEMGIAGEMEAADTNFKVQQIMGSPLMDQKRSSFAESISAGTSAVVNMLTATPRATKKDAGSNNQASRL